MEDAIDIAVLGAGDLIGEETLRLLARQTFPIGKVYALDSGGSVGQPGECGETRLVIADAADFDYARVQLVLSSVDASTAARCLPRAIAAGCVVVDGSGHFENDGRTPLVVAGHNPQALDRAARRLLTPAAQTPGQPVATPGYVAVQTIRVLGALHREFALTRVAVTVCHPAARGGRGGVESLARHSVAALSGSGIHAHGATQPFAVLPRPRAPDVEGNGAGEPEVARWLRALLGDSRLDLRISELLAPVFYDCTVVLDMDSDMEFDAQQVSMLLKAVPGVEISGSPPVGGVRRHGVTGKAGAAVPEAADDEDKAAVRVLWLRPTPHGRGLCLGFSADAVQCGVAGNHIGIAVELMREASAG